MWGSGPGLPKWWWWWWWSELCWMTLPSCSLLTLVICSCSFYTVHVLVLCCTHSSWTVMYHASPLHNLLSHSFCTTHLQFVLHSVILFCTHTYYTECINTVLHSSCFELTDNVMAHAYTDSFCTPSVYMPVLLTLLIFRITFFYIACFTFLLSLFSFSCFLVYKIRL